MTSCEFFPIFCIKSYLKYYNCMNLNLSRIITNSTSSSKLEYCAHPFTVVNCHKLSVSMTLCSPRSTASPPTGTPLSTTFMTLTLRYLSTTAYDTTVFANHHTRSHTAQIHQNICYIFFQSLYLDSQCRCT